MFDRGRRKCKARSDDDIDPFLLPKHQDFVHNAVQFLRAFPQILRSEVENVETLNIRFFLWNAQAFCFF